MQTMGKSKVIVISVVVTAVVGYLIYTGLRDTMTYYLTVPEVLAGTPEAQAGTIRVGGSVFADSVRWNPDDLKLAFRIGDAKAQLSVDYTGVVPDSFKPGREVIVEGRYTGGGKFVAQTIMPKCGSKYE